MFIAAGDLAWVYGRRKASLSCKQKLRLQRGRASAEARSRRAEPHTLGIGAIIGAGIFVLTGTAAAQYAGPAIVYSFILAGLGCLFAGLCYAEFAAMIPIAGSAYTYGYATLGELVAWIIGWDLILEYLFGASTVAVGWSGYFTAFMNELGFSIRSVDVLRSASGHAHLVARSSATIRRRTASQVAAHVRTRSLQPARRHEHSGDDLVGLMTTLLVVGIKESARFNNIIVIVKVAIVFLVIGFGFMYVELRRTGSRSFPPNTGDVRPVSAGAASCAAPA